MFLPPSVCLSARLLKKFWKDFNEISGGVGRGPKNNRLDFIGNPDHDQTVTGIKCDNWCCFNRATHKLGTRSQTYRANRFIVRFHYFSVSATYGRLIELRLSMVRRTGWSAYDGTCYRLYEERLTWNAAAEFCRGDSAYLVDVKSRSHLDWLRGFAKHTKFWIGQSAVT